MVGSRRRSVKPTVANWSSTHRAARSHSCGGYWRGSATDLIATSSASSVLTRGISSATRSARLFTASLLDRLGELQVVHVVQEAGQLVGAVQGEHQLLAGDQLPGHEHGAQTRS